jgi:hypothetical protein
MSGSLPSSSAPPAPESDQSDLLTRLSRARAVVQDGLDRLEMAQSDAEGKNHSLDAALQGDAPEGAGLARARKIAGSVAEDLEEAAHRLRQAAQP